MVGLALPVAVLLLALRVVLNVTGDPNSQDLDLGLGIAAAILAVVAMFPYVRRT